MTETIKFSNVKYYITLSLYFIIVVISSFVFSIFLYATLNGTEVLQGGISLFAISIVLIEYLLALIIWARRKISNKEVFSISENGIENAYAMIMIMIFFAIPTADLIPWSAIKEFKLTSYTFGRKYIVAIIDETKLSPQTSKLFKIAISLNSSRRNFRGLYFGSRSANLPAEELIKRLNQYHNKFS